MRYRNKLFNNRERIEIIDLLTNESKFFQKVPFSSEEFSKIKKLGSYFTNWICSSVNIFKK